MIQVMVRLSRSLVALCLVVGSSSLMALDFIVESSVGGSKAQSFSMTLEPGGEGIIQFRDSADRDHWFALRLATQDALIEVKPLPAGTLAPDDGVQTASPDQPVLEFGETGQDAVRLQFIFLPAP